MTQTYYPRVMVTLKVPVMGAASDRRRQAETRSTIEFSVVPKHVRITRNDFNAADECAIDFGWEQAGVDPRLLGNAIVAVYITDAGRAGPWAPRDSDLRFLGIAVSAKRSMSEGRMDVTLRALDFTTLFLSQKPLGDQGIPKYSQTLPQAWATICDNVGLYDYDKKKIASNVDLLRQRLELRGVEGDFPIGDHVLDRVRKGVLQVEPNSDAWTVWRIVCDSLGLITYIDADKCIVTTPNLYYEEESNPVVLRWGENVLEMEEERDLQHINGQGVHLTCINPMNYDTFEAFYPARDDKEMQHLKRKRVTASSHKKKASVGQALVDIKQYEHFNYPYSATEEALELIAERIWQERSRQELQGHVVTKEMSLNRRNGAPASVFDLRHGGPVMVAFDKDALDPLRAMNSEGERIRYLVQRGYSADIAMLLAADASFLARLLPVFAIRRLEYSIGEGDWTVTVGYCSRFNPDTGSTNG